MKTAITFIAPAHNEKREHRALLESLLHQYDERWELFVYHNGPNQEMKDWVNSYNDPRIKYLESETDTGSWGCHNRLDVLNNYLSTKYVVQTSIQDYFTGNAVGEILDRMEKENSDICYWDSLYYPKFNLFTSELKLCYIDWGNFCLPVHLAKDLSIRYPDDSTADGLTIQLGVETGKFNIRTKINSVLTIKN